MTNVASNFTVPLFTSVPPPPRTAVPDRSSVCPATISTLPPFVRTNSSNAHVAVSFVVASRAAIGVTKLFVLLTMRVP